MELKVTLLSENARVPTRAHATDAGLDLYAAEDVEKVSSTSESLVVPLDITVAIPPQYVGLILDRSSMAIKGYKVAGGVIDSGYTGPVKVVLHATAVAGRPQIQKGDKIAQLVVLPIALPTPIIVDSVEVTSRGVGGFGSSGV